MSITTNTTGEAAEAAALGKEAVMGQAVPRQHPAVVLRSRYRHVQSLLAVALIAVVSLSATVIALSTDDDDGPVAATGAAAAQSAASPSLRGDGGPEETAVATAVSPRATGPDEAKTAAAVGFGSRDQQTDAGRPHEGRVINPYSGFPTD
jgi:hypothetical protein